MNKSDLVTAVAERTGLSKKDSELALSAAFESITSALEAGEKVQIVGFGVFDVKERAARTGRNPQTGEEMHFDSPLPDDMSQLLDKWRALIH